MKGVMITEPGMAVVQEMKTSDPKENEVLIRVEAAGLCGSDLHIFKGVHTLRKPPVMPGHEVAGEVVAVGKDVKAIKKGDRVTVLPNNYCGQCAACMEGDTSLCPNKILPGLYGWEGTFGEYFTAPEKCVYRIKPETTYEQAVLAEPLAVAVRSVKRAGNGKRMLIQGCGTIGLMILKVALEKRYTEVYCTDTVAFNRKTALALGAAAAWDPMNEDVLGNINEATGGCWADAVMVAAAAPGILDQAFSAAGIHATVVLVAMMGKPQTVGVTCFGGKEITLTGTNTYTSEDFGEALELIEDGLDLSPLVTHKMPMSKVQQAFELYENKTEDVIKILIYPKQ
ncbi:MAG: alcohol dehydrogenase [Clostridia bacterium]|nr:alcohol dehydrogenase [Clostridia bacterium]